MQYYLEMLPDYLEAPAGAKLDKTQQEATFQNSQATSAAKSAASTAEASSKGDSSATQTAVSSSSAKKPKDLNKAASNLQEASDL